MTGKGGITTAPKRRLKLMLSAHLFWFGAVCLLGAWWGNLLLAQAGRIHELEIQFGLSSPAVESQWFKTQRMLYGESISFFGLLLVSTALVFGLYWRDAKRSRGLQAFFASVTHELRTPLTSIRLQAESIADLVERRPQGANDQERTLVQRLLEDTMRLEGQVERTLELARVEGGGPLFTQSLRIRPWIERVLASWRDTYGEKLEVITELEDLSIEADAGAIQVILKNLLENSIRHAKREKVRISLRSQATSRGQVALEFRDDGQGFRGDPSSLGLLFEKGPQSQGAGVGLYLVRMLMKRMGGRVDFQGGDGFGVVLRFRSGVSE